MLLSWSKLGPAMIPASDAFPPQTKIVACAETPKSACHEGSNMSPRTPREASRCLYWKSCGILWWGMIPHSALIFGKQVIMSGEVAEWISTPLNKQSIRLSLSRLRQDSNSRIHCCRVKNSPFWQLLFPPNMIDAWLRSCCVWRLPNVLVKRLIEFSHFAKCEGRMSKHSTVYT